MAHYAKMDLVDGQLVATEEKHIPQELLTADCWLIQFCGLSACDECEYRDSPDCGGGKTLEEMKRL